MTNREADININYKQWYDNCNWWNCFIKI